MVEKVKNDKEMRSLALTPTWSVPTVLTIFVMVSLIVERSIHRLSKWLRKTNRKPLLVAVEKMKEELMPLGFISLLLIATTSTIANICIPSKFYDSTFVACTRSEIDEELEDDSSKECKLLTASDFRLFRRMLNSTDWNTCKEGHEPFVSYEVLEQLHCFVFVMAITHVSYSCLTMLLAIVKIHSWRAWEDEARMDRHDILNKKARESIMRRQTAFVINHTSNPSTKNSFLMWVQFGYSVVRADYLTLRKGFILNHNLMSKYNFHSYMIRSMEEKFHRIVGVSGPLWGFVVAFMLFKVKGSNLYFWIAIIPITLVLLVGAKLQHVIATLALETAGIISYFSGARLRPQDELFWFKKSEWLLSLIHFILFQNAFELASFFWFWAALIPQRIRDTIHRWGKSARRKRRSGRFTDDSTIHTETSTVMSLEEYDHQLIDIHEDGNSTYTEVELQSPLNVTSTPSPFANETLSQVITPLLRPSSSISALTISSFRKEDIRRSSSMPVRGE